jgi:hypothetical protein
MNLLQPHKQPLALGKELSPNHRSPPLMNHASPTRIKSKVHKWKYLMKYGYNISYEVYFPLPNVWVLLHVPMHHAMSE